MATVAPKETAVFCSRIQTTTTTVPAASGTMSVTCKSGVAIRWSRLHKDTQVEETGTIFGPLDTTDEMLFHVVDSDYTSCRFHSN